MDKKQEPVYFSKIEYVEWVGYGIEKSIIFLDLENRELAYQVLKPKRMEMPAIQGIKTIGAGDYSYTYDASCPARVIKNGKTNFERKMIQADTDRCEVVFSDGMKLNEEQMKEILPYCNALDFEPYRGRKMSMSDEGYIGYRDEISTYFTAVTNSYIPKLELPMDYYYDEQHIWPSEKLYRFLIKTFFENNPKFRGYGLTYGRCSLFF